MTTLYIHGFGSSGNTSKVKQLQEILGPDELVLAPSLSHKPKDDFAMLAKMMWDHSIANVVGSSLGGFYALALTQWFDIRTVLINPSLDPSTTTARYLGTNKVFDTEATFEWTGKELQELRELESITNAAMSPEFSGVTWHRVLLLLAKNDTMLDSAWTAARMPRARIVFDSEQDHRFGYISRYADVIREILSKGFDIGEPDHFAV